MFTVEAVGVVRTLNWWYAKLATATFVRFMCDNDSLKGAGVSIRWL